MRDGRRIVILYEDSGFQGNFGPHTFVRACILDELGGELSHQQLDDLVVGIPKRGDSKLLAACEHDLEKLTSSGQQAVAVFDNDKIRRLLNLETGACKSVVMKVFTERCHDESVVLNLLENNTETVLEQIVSHSQDVSPKTAERAIKLKKRQERDLIFTAAARADRKHVRDAVLSENASLHRLIDKSVAILRS